MTSLTTTTTVPGRRCLSISTSDGVPIGSFSARCTARSGSFSGRVAFGPTVIVSTEAGTRYETFSFP